MWLRRRPGSSGHKGFAEKGLEKLLGMAHDRGMKERRHLFKILFPLLILAGGVFVLAVGACATNQSTSVTMTYRHPLKTVYDRDVGAAEKDIVRDYGNPLRTTILPAKELVGEIRSKARLKIPSDDTQVKELYYKVGKKERILWLTKQAEGEWKVFCDVEVTTG
jgi:hypothetical protein